MGSNFVTMTISATKTKKEVHDLFSQAQERDWYENGHSYSGGFSMATGLLIEKQEFPTRQAAYAYLDDACVKWEEARAVKHLNSDGSKSYLIGASCAC